MNRTDRLYALVEELRASAPAYRTAAELAEMYEVSTRTIERDIVALQEAGVPIWGAPGRNGGYSIDPDRTLPPVNFTPAEALAVAVAVEADRGPFAAAGQSARNKILSSMAPGDRAATEAMAQRVRRFHGRHRGEPVRVPLTVQRAITEQLVVAIDYRDRQGDRNLREVEPVGVIALDERWYLVGWCRLRHAPRSFRLDRIRGAQLTGERAPARGPQTFLEFAPLFIPRDQIHP